MIDCQHRLCESMDMTTEHIYLSDKQAEFINEIIASGRYRDINEVLRVSVHLLEERLAHEELQKEKLRVMLDEAKVGGLSELTPEQVWDNAETQYLKENA